MGELEGFLRVYGLFTLSPAQRGEGWAHLHSGILGYTVPHHG